MVGRRRRRSACGRSWSRGWPRVGCSCIRSRRRGSTATSVYCTDADRRETDPNERVDVLGDTFRARRSKNRWGQDCVTCSPAASAEATRDVRRELRGWHLHTRSDTSLEDLSRMCNPVLRGWVTDDSRFDTSALSPTFQHVERILVRWALRTYKRRRGHQRRAAHGLRRMSRRQPDLFAHGRLWQAAAGLSEPDEPSGSRPVP